MRRTALALWLLFAATSLQAASKYSFESDPLTFHEGDGTATVKVLRSGTLTATETVNYAWNFVFIPGGSGSLTFGPGEESKTFNITIPNDGYYTGGKPGAAGISDSVGHELAYTHLYAIDDEPVPTLTATPDSVSIVEGNSGSQAVTIHYKLSAPIGELENTYLILGGTAARNEDYTGPIVAPQMALHQTDFDITVNVLGDTVPEPDETIEVGMLITIQNAPVSIRGTATITILNDEYIVSPASQQIERGTSGSLDLTTSVPASSSERIVLSSSDPAVATTPPFVDIPAGATSATVPVSGLAPGSATISAQLPPSRGGSTLTSTALVYTPTSISFDSDPVSLSSGADTVVSAHLTPPPVSSLTLPIRNNHPNVVDVPLFFTVGTDGNGTIPVRALATGFAFVTVTLPPEYGHGEGGFGVSVAQPSGLSLTTVTPTSGPAFGEQSVTVYGNDVAGRCSLTFGGVPALNTALASGGSVTVTTPPHAPGPVEVAIRCGTEQSRLASAYTYIAAPPRLTRITPAAGSVSGGTLVTASGENLPRGRCGLWFGDLPAATLTNLQPSEMSAIAPPHGPGPVAVSLRCGGDVSTLNDGFVYGGDEPPAEMTAVVPSSGAPGDRVLIAGSRFRSSDVVAFGNAPAIDMTTGPAGHGVTVPELAPGPVTIALRDVNGRTMAGPSFTVRAPGTPQITAAPARATAGAEIVVGGTGFRPSFTFAIGGTTLPAVVLTGSSAIVRVPRTVAPQVTTLVLKDASGAALATRAIEVTASGIAIDAATPQCLSTDGGVLVTIAGSGFKAGAVITFGIADATEVTVRDGQTIVARAPASSGVADATITVTNPSLEIGQLTGGFHYRWPDSQCSGRPRPAHH